jgi:hypothetical protein
MRATIIPPVPLLEKYSKYNGGYHLILASLAKAWPNSYAKFYRSLTDKGEFVILDNDAYEEGVGASFETLKSLNETIRPSEIVLPDVLSSGSETYQKSEMAFQAFLGEHSLPNYPKFMGVPHGSTIDEWMKCAKSLVQLGVNSIGMARMYGEDPVGGMIPYLTELNGWLVRRFSDKCPMQVHLLGWSNRLDALSEVANMPFMEGIYLRGVDSSKPLTYASTHTTIGNYYQGRPKGYFEMGEWQIPEDIAIRNIHIFREYANEL